MHGSPPEPVLSDLSGPLRAIGSVVLPRPGGLDEEGWRRAQAIMERAIAPRPGKVKRQLRLFLRVVNLLPLLSTGHTLSGLSQARRLAFLQGLERSRVMLLRRGLWGVRTLLFMGYYTQEEVRAQIGYGARPEGWSALRGEGDGRDGGSAEERAGERGDVDGASSGADGAGRGISGRAADEKVSPRPSAGDLP